LSVCARGRGRGMVRAGRVWGRGEEGGNWYEQDECVREGKMEGSGTSRSPVCKRGGGKIVE
jgi:hypothetical protein